MKKKISIACAIGAFLIQTAATAQAYFLSAGTDVGGYDIFVGSIIDMNPSEANELAWINSLTGGTYTELKKSDTTESDWKQIFANPDGTGAISGGFAFALATDQPEYWLIKTGNLTGGKDGPKGHYLFQNTASLDWAVFNLDTEGAPYELSGVGKVSHVGEVGGGAPVPEPATALLFGAGLAGLAGIARRKK